MSTYYYVDPFGEHPTVATSMLQVLENDPDWDLWPDSEVEEESVAKWVRKDERPLQGRLSGWHPIRHLPTGNYLWIDYVAGYDPDMIPESFHFKRYGGNYDAVKHIHDAAYEAGIVFETGAPAVWDEHQMSEYSYEQDLKQKMKEPGLEEFASNPSSQIPTSVVCDWCGIVARFVVEDTATGTKAFCNETHMAMFLGLPIKPQGYYGYEVEMQRAEGWSGVSLTRGLEDIDEMLGKKIRKAAESSSAINLEDGDTHKLVIQRGTVPYGIIEVTRSGDEVDIYSRRYQSVDAKHFRAPYQPNQTLGDYFTPDLVYTSMVSDDWMTSALRFGDGSVSAEEYASQGDMGLIARYAYEPSEHFNDPQWNETHGAEAEHPLGGPMSSLESRRLYYPYDSYGHHFATIFNKTAPMSVSYPMGEYKAGGDLDKEFMPTRGRGRNYPQKTWIPYGFLQITTEGQNVEMVVIDNEGEVLDDVQLLEDEDDEDFDFSPPKIIEGKRWDLGDIDGMSGVEKSMIWRRVEVGEAEPWPFLDVTVDVQGLGFHGVDSFQLTIQNPYTGEKYIDISVPVDNIPSGDWWEAESDLSEIEWQLDQQPDLFTDWMAWCENFPTDRKLHQQILIDTYREETGHIGSWDTAVEWWNTLPPRSQESIFNTGKVWNTFLTWRNALQWAAEDVSQVTKDQVHWLKDNRFPVLINVLDPKYTKKLNISGSLNIPISNPDKFKKEILKRVPKKDALIIVYCANEACDASYRAYNALKRMGYTNVFEYDAGLEGWFWPLTLKAEGDPPWVVAARKVLYGNDWWDIDWSVKDESPKEDWIKVEWDAESDPNAYKGASSTTPSMSNLPSMTLPTLYKQDTKGKLRQWTISVEPHSSGNGFVLISEAGLVNGSRVPKEGQHITAGAQNRTPFQQAELQARSKWKKKSDKGYYDDLQKAKGQVKTLPMTAHKYWKIKNGQKVKDRGRDINFPAVAQRKYDGVRAHLQVLSNGTVRITSRSGLPTGLLLAGIRSDALQLGLPDNIILDGEIYAGQKPGTTEPLHPLKLINGAVSSKTLKPKHMQILGDIKLYVYDAVLLDDPDADFVTRYRTAAKYLAPYTGNKFELVPNYIVKNETEMEGLFRKYLQEGYEGLMIRNAKGSYQFSRSKNLQKVKPAEDDEFEIIGYAEGTGSHSGMVIWECALPNGKSFTVVPKGTHAERKTWFKEAQQGQHIGKLLTVEYAYLTDDGVPFHPRGKTFYVKV